MGIQTGMTAVVLGMTLGFSPLNHAKAPDSERTGFSPSVQLAYQNDDNIFRQENNEERDGIATIAPDLGWRWNFGKQQLSLQYVGLYAEYDTNDNENYDDHAINADLFFDLTPKFNIDLQANYELGHESRGSSGLVAGITSAVPNEWRAKRLFSQFTYGRRAASAQLQLDLEAKTLRYTNNSQGFRDRNTDTVTGRFFYRLGPKTTAIFEATYRDIDYISSAAVRNLDSEERLVRLGLRWEATYKTTGELKIGRFKKTFDSPTEEDISGTSIEAVAIWEPLTYSRVTFTALREPNEAATADSSYVSSTLTADWQHDFSSRTTFNANISDRTDNYSGTRKDDLFNVGLGIDYKLKRWLNIGASYRYSERDSNVVNASYDDNIFMFNVEIAPPQ